MEVTNVASLPADILHLLFEQIADGGDEFPRYATLYNCVVSSKHLSNAGAVTALWRICNDAPVKGGGNEGLPLAEQNQMVQRWAVLWRTIILSALGKTMFPYCRNLRLLDLRDLGELLADDKFRGKTIKTFFEGDLKQYHFTMTGNKGAVRLDTGKIVRAVGDILIQQAPLLEGLWEPMTSDVLTKALPDWAPFLAHLRRLMVWDGKAFASETTRNLLHAHCPNLESLGIFMSTDPDSDHVLAEFIGGMQPNRLVHFENHGNCRIGQATCLALSVQGASLKTLKLYLGEEGIMSLGLLQGCTALRELSLVSDRPSPDLKTTQNDVFLEVLEWLKCCCELKRLTFNNLVSAPDLALPILQNKEVRLDSLDIIAKEEGMYVVKDHHDFHQALTQQRDLQSVQLKADPEPTSRDDLDTLMNSLCSLTRLQDLRLVRISDYFSDEHVKLLARYLPDLRELSVGGYGVSDAALQEVANLRYLRNVTFSGITTFTTAGIVEFIDKLGTTNTGITIAVDNADPDAGISVDEQDMLRELAQTKLDGRFEYQLLRGKKLASIALLDAHANASADPNAPVFESDDSD